MFMIIYIEVHCHGTGKIFSFFNGHKHEVLSFVPAIILTMFFCKVNIFPLLDELPQISIPCFYCRVKIGKIG